MTHAEFLRDIQAYFGEYPQGQRKYIAEYVHNIPQEHIEKLFYTLLKNVPSQYKTPPDIAMMRQYDGQVVREICAEGRKKVEAQFQLPEPEKEEIEYDVTGIFDDLRTKLKLPIEKRNET
jgi:hypothetical protein